MKTTNTRLRPFTRDASSHLIFYFVPLLLTILLVPRAAFGDSRVEKNVVYGMYSGLALLMDVHHPEKPNGYGLVLIPGSGWHTSQAYDGASIKDGGSEYRINAERIGAVGYSSGAQYLRNATPRQ